MAELRKCAGCGRPIKHCRILGWLHVDDLSYWCWPNPDENTLDLTVPHASEKTPYMIFDCPSTPEKVGY